MNLMVGFAEVKIALSVMKHTYLHASLGGGVMGSRRLNLMRDT